MSLECKKKSIVRSLRNRGKRRSPHKATPRHSVLTVNRTRSMWIALLCVLVSVRGGFADVVTLLSKSCDVEMDTRHHMMDHCANMTLWQSSTFLFGLPRDDHDHETLSLMAWCNYDKAVDAFHTSYRVTDMSDFWFRSARRWWTRAYLAHDDATAAHNVGVLYFHGYGVTQDVSMALALFHYAAHFDNPVSLAALSDYYLSTGADRVMVEQYCRRAAKAGHAVAQIHCRSPYPPISPWHLNDWDKAMRYFRMAFDRGYNPAAKEALLRFDRSCLPSPPLSWRAQKQETNA